MFWSLVSLVLKLGKIWVIIWLLNYVCIFVIALTPWTIYVLNLPLPCKWPSTVLHTNGSLYREHNSLYQFKMVSEHDRGFSINLFLTILAHCCEHICRYLDVAGQKNSKLYTLNGVALFVMWLVMSIEPQTLVSLCLYLVNVEYGRMLKCKQIQTEPAYTHPLLLNINSE